MQTQHQHTDLKFLNSFTGGDAEKMKKYINMFLVNSKKMDDEINMAVQQNDRTAVKLKVHALKSQLSYMGANALSQEASYIENNIEQSGDEMNARVIELLEHIAEARIELEQQLNQI
ncbi:MAG TPA: Hpt domain-containing protein [Bacteroidia bacterium]|nr:Hpt domain-containing protein [Bacteroidia bacterium]